MFAKTDLDWNQRTQKTSCIYTPGFLYNQDMVLECTPESLIAPLIIAMFGFRIYRTFFNSEENKTCVDMAYLLSRWADCSLPRPPRPDTEGHHHIHRFHMNFVLSLWDVNIAPFAVWPPITVWSCSGFLPCHCCSFEVQALGFSKASRDNLDFKLEKQECVSP